MHQLLEQLPPEQMPRKHGGRPHAAGALAKDHFPISTHQDLDCQQCSDRAAARKRSRIICADCGVHLCVGACFSLYHSDA